MINMSFLPLRRMAGTICVVILASILGACGGGGEEGGSPPPRPDGSVSGVAFDGLIVGGSITARSWVTGEVLGTATTDDQGKYSITLNASDGWVLLEITGGRYVEEATLVSVNLRKEVDYLRAVIYYTSGDTITTSVTVFTTIAVGLMEHLISTGQNVSDAMTSANRRISDWVGVDVVTTTPIDITLETSQSPSIANGHRYGFTTAAISELTRQQSILSYGETEVHRLHTSIAWAQLAYLDIRHDGLLDGRGAGGTLAVGAIPVTVEDYRYNTARAMVLIAANPNNNTNFTAMDLLLIANTFASSTDVMFGGLQPRDLELDALAPNITLILPEVLTGVATVAPVVISATDTIITAVYINMDDGEWLEAEDPAAPSWALNTTVLVDGPHTISIRAEDLTGAVGEDSVIVLVQNGEIVVSIAPPNGTHVREDVSLEVQATTVPGLSVDVVQIYTDNGFLSLAAQDGSWRYDIDTLTLPDGEHSVVFHVEDTGSREIDVSHSVVVDNTYPILTSTLVDDQWYQGTLGVEIAVTDANLRLADLYFDGMHLRPLSAGTTVVSIPTTSIADSTDPANAPHVVVIADDRAGNQTTLDTPMLVDNTAPSVTLTYPVGGTKMGRGVTLRMRVTELSSGVADARFYVDGNSISGGASCSGTTGADIECTKDIDTGNYSHGTHTVGVQAIDEAGNASTMAIAYNVLFDNEGPTLNSWDVRMSSDFATWIYTLHLIDDPGVGVITPVTVTKKGRSECNHSYCPLRETVYDLVGNSSIVRYGASE